MRVLIVSCLVFLLWGCEEFSQEFEKSFDESFNSSFKESFIEGCSKENPVDEVVALCSCLADDLLANKSVKELISQEGLQEYIRDIGIPKCRG